MLAQLVTVTPPTEAARNPRFETFRAGYDLTSLRKHPVMEPIESSKKRIVLITGATGDQMRDLNLSSAFYTFRAAIPYLRKSGSGRIVAIDSLTAVEPHAGLGAYVTFKSALTMLVRTVALENRDAGLMANVVLPGTMDTPANRKSMPNADFSKWVQPKEVAELVLSLSDVQTRHITGVAVPIEGEGV